MAHHPIKRELDVYAARQAVERLGARVGFPRRDCQELVIVVSELCSNIVKYGIRGSLELDTVSDPAHGVGVLIAAHDDGPPFRDLGMALQDGCDDRGPIDPAGLLGRTGLGIGLGAVVRLTDSFEVEQSRQGKSIRAVRFLKRPRVWRSGGSSF